MCDDKHETMSSRRALREALRTPTAIAQRLSSSSTFNQFALAMPGDLQLVVEAEQTGSASARSQ